MVRRNNRVPDVGSFVSFRISDAYLPEARELLERINDQNILVGRVIEFSDCGPARNIFAVLELREGQRVIVAVEKLAAPESRNLP
jgi:hypothetical protein